MDHPAVGESAIPGVRVVVRDLHDLPGIPETVATPQGPRSPGRTLREWRQLLAEQGGMKDPWGNVHPVDLSPWDGADPDTRLIVALLAKR